MFVSLIHVLNVLNFLKVYACTCMCMCMFVYMCVYIIKIGEIFINVSIYFQFCMLDVIDYVLKLMKYL